MAPERISSARCAGERSAVSANTRWGWARTEGVRWIAPPNACRWPCSSLNTSGPGAYWSRPVQHQPASLADHPQLSIAPFEGSRPAIAATFGGRNPDDFLQYVAVGARVVSPLPLWGKRGTRSKAAPAVSHRPVVLGPSVLPGRAPLHCNAHTGDHRVRRYRQWADRSL